MDATNRNTALASALVEELARCGVRRAAIAPGSRSSPLALALLRAPAIEATPIVDERSAGFFALGAAQATGTPTAVVCTSGTAAANLHPAVCEADESGVPVIILTSDRPPELRGIGAGQTIDQLKLYGDAVRWFCEVGTHHADDAGLIHFRSVGCRAFAAARGDPRPGPVHLNLAWRDPLGPEPHEDDVTATSPLALEGRGQRPFTAVTPSTSSPSDVVVELIAGHLTDNPRGLLVCGRQTDPSLADPIAELARATGYPILAEPTSQLRVGTHDRSQIVCAYDAIARARPAALAPDFVLRFGEMPTSKALRQWLAHLPACNQLVVDARFGWSEPTRLAAAMIRAEPIELAQQLAEALSDEPAGGWTEAWLAADRAVIEATAEALDGEAELSEPAVHAALGDLYADGELVYTASSMPIRDQEYFLPSGAADVRFLCNRGANGIDGLISSGIGAAVASGRPTWIVTGDLGLFHDMNGLAILREVEVPVRIVVLDNRGGGIFEFLPQAEQVTRDEFEAIFGTPLELDLERVAALHDLRHARVESLAELGAAGGTDSTLIEIPVLDRRRNVELHRRLNESAERALETAITEASKPT